MMLRVKHIVTTAALLVCLMALPVLAQDAVNTATPSSADNIGTMIIILGLGVIVGVGARIYMREKRREVD